MLDGAKAISSFHATSSAGARRSFHTTEVSTAIQLFTANCPISARRWAQNIRTQSPKFCGFANLEELFSADPVTFMRALHDIGVNDPAALALHAKILKTAAAADAKSPAEVVAQQGQRRGSREDRKISTTSISINDRFEIEGKTIAITAAEVSTMEIKVLRGEGKHIYKMVIGILFKIEGIDAPYVVCVRRGKTKGDPEKISHAELREKVLRRIEQSPAFISQGRNLVDLRIVLEDKARAPYDVESIKGIVKEALTAYFAGNAKPQLLATYLKVELPL